MLQFLIRELIVSIFPYLCRYSALDRFISIAHFLMFFPCPRSLGWAYKVQSLTAFTWMMLQDDVDWKDVNWICPSSCFFRQKIGWRNRAAFDLEVTCVFSLCRYFLGLCRVVGHVDKSSLNQSLLSEHTLRCSPHWNNYCMWCVVSLGRFQLATSPQMNLVRTWQTEVLFMELVPVNIGSWTYPINIRYHDFVHHAWHQASQE